MKYLDLLKKPAKRGRMISCLWKRRDGGEGGSGVRRMAQVGCMCRVSGFLLRSFDDPRISSRESLRSASQPMARVSGMEVPAARPGAARGARGAEREASY